MCITVYIPVPNIYFLLLAYPRDQILISYHPQIHAGGAHFEEREACRQPRSRGFTVQPSGLYGSEEPAGGGRPGERAGGRQDSAQTV